MFLPLHPKFLLWTYGIRYVSIPQLSSTAFEVSHLKHSYHWLGSWFLALIPDDLTTKTPSTRTSWCHSCLVFAN